MEYFNWILQQDFNKIYTNIENCIIVKPPYLNWRVPHTFYFDKRGWFSVFELVSFDKIYDTLHTSSWDYYIWTIWTDTVLKKWVTTLYTWAIQFDRNYKFIYWTSVKWISVENWTWLVSSIIDPLNIFLEDVSKAWTIDAYAWKFIYIYIATTWTGQILKITSNTATQLSVWWFEADITGWTYKIFDELWSVPFVIWWDWLYWIHDDTEIIKAENFSNITDIVTVHDRFFSIDINWNINKWFEWQHLLYQDADSHVKTVENVLNLTSFQDYLLILSSDSISLIKQENITVWWDTQEIYTWSLVTRDFWIFSINAFEIYNEWLYLLDSNRKFISLSINAVTDSKFTTVISDEWIYIQKDLDNIWSSSSVWVEIDSNEIKIINTLTWSTNFYIYDRYYKWWHKWNSLLEIYWYNNTTLKYYWTDIYFVDHVLIKDESVHDIVQKIKLIFWEENMTAFKRIIFQKLILWSFTTEWFIIEYTITSWEDLIVFPKEVKWTQFLRQWASQVASSWSSLWQSIMWLWLIWDNDDSLDYLYPKVWAVKVNLWYACELMEAELIAASWKKIVFWWQLIWYEQAHPWLTSVKNTI